MVWDVYENKENKKQEAFALAEFEKNRTTSDIFDADYFNEKLTSLRISVIDSTPLNPQTKINVTDEKQQKRMMDAINNLQVQKTLFPIAFQDVDYVIVAQLNKEYGFNVFEKEKQIAFFDLSNNSNKVDDELLYQYKILKGDDELFDILKDFQ